MAKLKLTNLVVALLGCVFASGCGDQRNQRTEAEIPAGWNLKEPSINVADGVRKPAGAVFPQRIWIKRDSESTYILLEAKGLKEQIKSEMDHVEHFHQAHQASDGDVFLVLWFDSDGNPSTGGPGENILGQQLSGFDTRADFYIGAMNSWSDATLPHRVVNCMFSKWTRSGDRQDFATSKSWGTQFNDKMSVTTTGDYASFAIPRLILDVSPQNRPARVAFELPHADYVTPPTMIATIEIGDK